MAKINGLFGSMTGKLGDVVMSVRNGVQIVRKYQPVVYNPSTTAQVALRAKLKALSQLTAIMAPVIPLRRIGTISPRNRFFKLNYGAVTFSNDTASIALENVRLTNSVVALPGITATREADGIKVSLSGSAPDLSRVVYVAFVHNGDEIRYSGSVVVEEPGSGINFPAAFGLTTANMLYYAYGVRDNSEAARIAFGNLTVPSAATIATLLVSSTLLESDVTLTESKYVSLAAANAKSKGA